MMTLKILDPVNRDPENRLCKFSSLSMMDMSALDLIRLQIGLEYQLNPGGFLMPFPGSSERARFIVYIYAYGFVRYFRHDLPVGVRKQLSRLKPIQAFYDLEGVKTILAEHAACDNHGLFKSYFFKHLPHPQDFPDVELEGKNYVIKQHGQVISRARSERSNPCCAEVAVETRPGFRRRGYARQVVAAWARAVMLEGRVAFYSHAATNYASQGLARSLGAVRYALVTGYD